MDLEEKLREMDFEIHGYIEALHDNTECMDQFKKDKNCLIHFVNRQELKAARDQNLEYKEKIDTKTSKLKKTIKEKTEDLEKNQQKIDELKENIEKNRSEIVDIWKQIIEMEKPDFDYDKIEEPDDFGSKIKEFDARYNVSCLYDLCR
jgi:chromosome segregation ATPase